MKKTVIFILIIVVGFVIYRFLLVRDRKPLVVVNKTKQRTLISTPTGTVKKVEKVTSLFVPYWAIGDASITPATGYEELAYFGVSVSKEGLDTQEPGYKNLEAFTTFAQGTQKKMLVLRMFHSPATFAILEKKELQKKLALEVSQLAKQYGFSGIVLDLEISSLAFDSVVNSINTFISDFAANVKKEELQFYITVYGDSFYRARPYTVGVIAKNADKVMIMAYDFSKARGNPGPSFPLQGKNIYGYDFQTMIDDFSTHVDKNKLVIIFGLFGYDWTVDENNTSITSLAKAVSFSEAKAKFIDSCILENCSVERNAISTEMKVTYNATDGNNHVVWFADMDSMEKKKAYAKQKGIESVAYWAYSYF